MKTSVLSLTSTQKSEFEKLANIFPYGSGYIKLPHEKLPTAIPKSLRKKMPIAVLMFEKTTDAHTYIVCNGIRHDKKANALDQEPFGVVVYSTGSSPSGVFIHHGKWARRSVPITPELQGNLTSTGLGDYFPLTDIPSASSGPISDLKRTSQEGAFKTMMAEITS
jgi:hypothetical protein